ncbi:MAG: hypothetical protein IJY36_08695 [Coprobacter sp.]|nr:hypothetical protein [Coprobacter sp.]
MRVSEFVMCVCILIFASCEGKYGGENIKYKKYLSHNKQYEVEIPDNFTQTHALGDLLAFQQSSTNLILVIDILEDNKSIHEYLKNRHSESDFDYNLYTSSDSTYYYKITRGLNPMWCAYELNAIKIIGDRRYKITLSSASQGREYMEILIKHIQESLSIYNRERGNLSKKQNQSNDLFHIRNTDYYSIEYPKTWKIIAGINEMTDVYIGSENDKLGFTIVFFDTEYSLFDIYNESKSNMIAAGAKLVLDKKDTINGEPCFVLSFEYQIEHQHIKDISYIFKKNNTMFSIKFGTDKNEINTNAELIKTIINSFQIK